jgi:hypothetical protein
MSQSRILTSFAIVVASLMLGACGTQMKKAKSELAELADLLPGRYNNVAQAEEDAKQGTETHAALMLDIVRVDIPLLSDYVFYVQESAAGDARRVTQQRLLTFEATKDGAIVERVYSFAQPGRWRDGHLNAGLFTGLMFKDTTPLNGCELSWKKDGEKFVGANNRESCRVTTPALGSTKVDMRAELTADELALAELSYSGSKLVQGNTAEPFYRFRRGGSP